MEIESSNEPETTKSRYLEWIPFGQLFERYDATFVILLGLVYFNQGVKSLIGLAVASMFKDTY